MLGQILVNGLVVGSGYALIAIGHTVIFGLMRIANWAHGDLYMLGAFLSFTFVGLGKLPFAAGVIMALVIALILGALLELSLFRRIRDGDIATTSALLTVGLSLMLRHGAEIIWGAAPRNVPHPFSRIPMLFGNVVITEARIFVVIVAVAAFILLHLVIRKTQAGRAFRATFQQRDAALLSGIDVNKVFTINLAIGTALAALGGLLLGTIYPIEPTMGAAAIGKAWVVVVSGGLGNFAGAITVAYILGIVENLTAGYISSEWQQAVGFFLMFLVLIFRPHGIFSKSSTGK